MNHKKRLWKANKKFNVQKIPSLRGDFFIYYRHGTNAYGVRFDIQTLIILSPIYQNQES